MRDLAYIARIEDLKPIEGKDRIELAAVAGWEVIVEKNRYNIGDLVVYAEYDTILPANNPNFEFLRKRCYSKTYDGFRIRNMTMAGHVSQGIVFPLSILPPEAKARSVYKEGTSVAALLGIRKYDPEALREEERLQRKKNKNKLFKLLMKNKLFKKTYLYFITPVSRPYPKTVAKADEMNIQKLFDEYKANDTEHDFYYVTEKLEGQAAVYMLHKNKYMFFSHNVDMTKAGNSNWQYISDKYKMKDKLKEAKKLYRRQFAIMGEIVGPGIQKNIYKFPDKEFFVYKIVDTDTGLALEFDELQTVTNALGLTMVPILEPKITLDSFKTISDVLEYSNGPSVFKEAPMREGVVFRHVYDQRIGFKAKSPKYLIWWDKKDITE